MISLIVGVLMFVMVYYLGDVDLKFAIICAVISFLSNIMIGINANKKKKSIRE